MSCKICGTFFAPRHFNQRCCSPECRKQARRNVLKRYKATPKGVATEMRWRVNPRKKEIDKAYRQTPQGRARAVASAVRQLATNEYAQQMKKRTDHIYMSRTQGRLRAWWREEAAKGCAHCGTLADLTVDHVVPKSLGGSDDKSNLQVLCRACNGKKGNRLD